MSLNSTVPPTASASARTGRIRGVRDWQVLCLLVGLAASLIPALPRTHAFWGCHRAWIGLAPDQIQVYDVLPGSPAATAGFKEGDRVLAIGGRGIDGVEPWDQMATTLRPGQRVEMRVRRDGGEQTLTVVGVEPQLAGIVYGHWQLAFAGACIVLLLLLQPTRAARSRAPSWRSLLLVVAGLGGAVTLLFREGRGGYALLGARWPIDRLPFPWVQLVLCVAVAFGLAALAAWELRGKTPGVPRGSDSAADG